MKSPLVKAIAAVAAWVFFFQVIMPSVFQTYSPASSSLCLEPTPPNQIKSIQIYPESAAGFFPPAWVRSLRPQIIRVAINPHFCPDPEPRLFINCENWMMEVNHDFVREPRGVFDTPFTEESLQAVFDQFKAPHSPQQGTINVSEVYNTIKAASAADIKDKDIPGLNNLSHYKVSYVFPYEPRTNPMDWMVAFFIGMSFYRSSNKKS